jgi:nucleotide-binding universal stress UspA family protein
MRVLIATDGSDDARAAVRFLARFPLPVTAEVRALSVVTLPESALDIPPVREYRAALRDQGRATADAARAELARRFLVAGAELREGDPREVIPRAAEEWDADLVAVGARGLGAFAGLLLGSVSTAVIHGVRCPVLVVKGGGAAVRRVVVAVDGSPDSLAAARFLASLPLDGTVDVRLLAVAEPPRPSVAPTEILLTAMAPALERVLEERRAVLEGLLSRLEAEFRGRAASVQSSVVVGQPAAAIVESGAEAAADLVVVGARGAGALARLVLGSVSDRVVRHAGCPVLVVKRRS